MPVDWEVRIFRAGAQVYTSSLLPSGRFRLRVKAKDGCWLRADCKRHQDAVERVIKKLEAHR